MNKTEAMKLMLEGKNVRRKCWLINAYIYFDGSVLRNENNEIVNFNDISTNNDWELYREPKKKKVTMYKWAFKPDSTTIWTETSSFYSKGVEVREYKSNVELKRLDYTATEFEVEE